MPAQGLFGLSGAYSGLWAGVGLSTALSVEGFPLFVSSAAKQACCYFDLAPSASTGDEGPRRDTAPRAARCLFLKHFSE